MPKARPDDAAALAQIKTDLLRLAGIHADDDLMTLAYSPVSEHALWDKLARYILDRERAAAQWAP